MEMIPLYSYMSNYVHNPIGIMLYNEQKEEIGQYIGTDIIDGYVYINDGFEMTSKDLKECYVIEEVLNI